MLNTLEPQDFAIVIGIDRYDDPSFSKLRGAPEDAKHFIDWLKKKYNEKAGLGNRQIIYKLKEATQSDILRVFHRLLDKAEGTCHGRLYIFVSGHGCGASIKENVLFTSETSRHGPVCFDLIKTADALRYSGLFKEVILFVDCCREMKGLSAPGLPLKLENIGTPATHFYCFASMFGFSALEQTFGTADRGLFSTHLLRALKGLTQSAIDHKGRVTAHTLATHLSAMLAEQGSPSKPDFDPRETRDLRDMVFASGFPPRILEVTLSEPGKGFSLFSGENCSLLEWSRRETARGVFRVEREEDVMLLAAKPAVVELSRAETVKPVLTNQGSVEL